MEDEQKIKILDWLCPNDYGTEQSDLFNKRQQGTGRWFLDSDQFQQWFNSPKQTLLCQGIPGAGKTVMMSIVIDYLGTMYQDDQSIGVVFIYCNFRRQYQQKPYDLLSCLLKQLAWQQNVLPKVLEGLYQKHNVMKTQLSYDEILGALQIVICEFQRVFIVVDALDEIQVPDAGRAKFLSNIFHLQESTCLNLLATSRFALEIEEQFGRKGSIFLEIKATDEDVKTYIEGHISMLQPFVSKDLDMENEIKRKIINAGNGM